MMLSQKKVDDKLTEIIPKIKRLKGLVVPHAGHIYSGPTASFSYELLQRMKGSIKTIFVIGVSHHVHFKGCALSPCTVIETPLGNIDIDLEIMQELSQSKLFVQINKEEDEDEHSLEMQYPFIKKVMEN